MAEGTAGKRVRLPEGAFSIIPRYRVDRDGRVNVVDVCDTLASLATLLGLTLNHVGEDVTLSENERDGLVLLARFLETSFSDLGEMFDRRERDLAIEAACLEEVFRRREGELAAREAATAEPHGEGDEASITPRRRSEAPAPDLTEPADPPRAANG